MAETVEPNWVKLTVGVPVRLHFKDHRIISRPITDRLFGVPRQVNSLIFMVDRLNGNAVDMRFSAVSDRLIGEFTPYLEAKRYANYEFEIIKEGPEMAAPRISRVIPI